MAQMRIKDLMKKDLTIISADSTLQEAAQKMAEVNCGSLPVGDNNELEGVITDRDIVVRAVAKGKDTNEEIVRDYMTTVVHTVRASDTPDRAAMLMHDKNISRVLVEDDKGKPCGILTFGRIIRIDDNREEVQNVIECAVGRKAA